MLALLFSHREPLKVKNATNGYIFCFCQSLRWLTIDLEKKKQTRLDQNLPVTAHRHDILNPLKKTWHVSCVIHFLLLGFDKHYRSTDLLWPGSWWRRQYFLERVSHIWYLNGREPSPNIQFANCHHCSHNHHNLLHLKMAQCNTILYCGTSPKNNILGLSYDLKTHMQVMQK